MNRGRQFTISNKLFFATIVLAVAMLSVGNTWASGIPIGIKDVETGEPIPEAEYFADYDSTGGMLLVGDSSGPVGIYLDPTMPDADWPKIFIVDIAGVGIEPGDTIVVMEFLTLFAPPAASGIPSEPLTDWHETIHAPDWEWSPVSSIEFPGSGDSFPGAISPDGKEIWFDFPPMMPSPTMAIDFKITKELVWTGGVVTGTGPPSETIIEIPVWERATTTIPEPSSFILIGLGAIGLGCFRSKKRSR